MKVPAETKTEETRSFIRQATRVTGRKFTPKQKVQTMSEGIQGKLRVSDRCRREGIGREPGGPGGIRTPDSRTCHQDMVARGIVRALSYCP